MNGYEKAFWKNLAEFGITSEDDLHRLSCPETARPIVAELLEYGCLCQNYVNIMLGRKGIARIPSSLLLQTLSEAAQQTIDFSDDYEYRRLLEIVGQSAPAFLPYFRQIGSRSSCEDIRETAEEFQPRGS